MFRGVVDRCHVSRRSDGEQLQLAWLNCNANPDSSGFACLPLGFNVSRLCLKSHEVVALRLCRRMCGAGSALPSMPLTYFGLCPCCGRCLLKFKRAEPEPGAQPKLSRPLIGGAEPAPHIRRQSRTAKHRVAFWATPRQHSPFIRKLTACVTGRLKCIGTLNA